jgi:4-hydroxybenzoate polyprenyltransferase
MSQNAGGNMVLFGKITDFFKLVKFEHSLFALPFAYLGLFVAEGGLPRLHIALWVTVAMVALRTAAMCLNRLIDRAIDEENPRTYSRINLIKSISPKKIRLITIFSLILFVVSAVNLNALCLKLSAIPIVLIIVYPFSKKFTWCSHFILGIILGIAPCGGWFASSAEWSWIPVVLALAVCLWVSGFDMFYALQDIEFDRTHGLHSFPARFGFERTIKIAGFLHGVAIVLLGCFGWMVMAGIWYWLGWFLALILMVREHGLVRQFGLSKINEAFFNLNAWVSVIIFLSTFLDLIL